MLEAMDSVLGDWLISIKYKNKDDEEIWAFLECTGLVIDLSLGHYGMSLKSLGYVADPLVCRR